MANVSRRDEVAQEIMALLIVKLVPRDMKHTDDAIAQAKELLPRYREFAEAVADVIVGG